MKNSLQNYLLGVLLAILLFLPIHYAHCQFKPEYPCDQQYQASMTYTQPYQMPPLFTDMPLECMIGYIACDSIIRTKESIEYSAKPFLIGIDTLRALLRYLYSIKDYCPYNLSNYTGYFVHHGVGPGLPYKSAAGNVFHDLIDAMIERMNEIGENYSYLIYTDYIYKIKILDVCEGIDSSNSMYNQPWRNAFANIQQVIKGSKMPGNCQKFAPYISPEGLSIYQPDSCFIFGYYPQYLCGSGFVPSPENPRITVPVRNVNINDEYIIFLKLDVINNTTKSITLYPAFDQTCGLFKITNGRVEDTGNFFGLGTNPTVVEFTNKVSELISHIKSWWVR